MSRTPQATHDALVRRAEKRGDPPPPVRPGPFECCDRNCAPCVWDYYEEALRRWEARHDLAP